MMRAPVTGTAAKGLNGVRKSQRRRLSPRHCQVSQVSCCLH